MSFGRNPVDGPADLISDEEDAMSKCDCLRCNLEMRVALLERDKCQQRNCILAVNLAHAMRTIANHAEREGEEEIAMKLRTTLRNAGGYMRIVKMDDESVTRELKRLMKIMDAQEAIIDWYEIENEREENEDDEIPEDLLKLERALFAARGLTPHERNSPFWA